MHTNPYVMAAFADELQKIAAEKDASLGAAVRGVAAKTKNVLTAPIPGTRPWFLGQEEAVRAARRRSAGSLAGAPRRQGQGAQAASKPLGGGVYDVSDLARSMQL